MNGFQKRYWQRKKEINKKLLKYYLLSFVLSSIVNLPFFYGDRLEILFAKIMVLTMLIMGVMEAMFNLPSFYIEENKHNKAEVRTLIILTPLVLYILLISGKFFK